MAQFKRLDDRWYDRLRAFQMPAGVRRASGEADSASGWGRVMTEHVHPPIPVPDEQSAEFWAAAADHVLVLARCTHCGSRVHPPGVVCAHCLHPDPRFEFTPVDGRGTVRSWTVIRDSFLPGFRDAVPFVLVDVELDVQTDLRMIGRLIDGLDEDLQIGDRVSTVFEDIAPGVAVPAFALDRRT